MRYGLSWRGALACAWVLSGASGVGGLIVGAGAGCASVAADLGTPGSEPHGVAGETTGSAAEATHDSAASASATAPHARPTDLPTRRVDLRDWGMTSLEALRYANVGVLEQAGTSPLIVYHLGDADPADRATGEPTTAPPPMKNGVAFVGHGEGGNKNRFGGYFNGFAKAPSKAVVSLEREDDAPARRTMIFDFNDTPGGFAGFWVHLFETRALPGQRVYLDGSDVGWLTFEIRGDAGGEALRLQMADRAWETRQDSLPIGAVGEFLPSGAVDTGWQRAWVPLSKLPPRLDRARLANIIFLVESSPQDRSGRVHIRDLAFTAERALPMSAASPVANAGSDEGDAPGSSDTSRSDDESLAMWLWETNKLLADPTAQAELVAFCLQRGFTDLFIQIPYIDHGDDPHWSRHWDKEGMGGLIKRLSAADIRVHALDGAAWFARPVWHRRVLATVESVAAYNASAAPDERFHGMRFDIEPYLLPEYQGERKERILKDYLDLLTRIQPVTREAGLVLGVDIPFWFDARDERSGDWAAAVNGRPMTERILDIVDNIGVMDYRTVAFGADGVLAHAEDEIAYADKVGKQVFIGLETVVLPDEEIMTFSDGARSPWAMSPDLVIEPLDADGGQAGSAVQLTWIPESRRRQDGAYPWMRPGSRLLRHDNTLFVPASKITFSEETPHALENVMRQARIELMRHRSFAGYVIHSYESYRPWAERKGNANSTIGVAGR